MNEQTLLTIIAAAALLSTVGVIAVALYTIQLGRSLVRLEERLSSLIATTEDELKMTLHEVRETTRGMTELTGSSRRLIEQVVAASVVAKVAPQAMRAVDGIKTGMDIARAAMTMYDRYQRKKRSEGQE